MTKKEKINYLKEFVDSQGTQIGLSASGLLEEIINGTE